MGEPTNPNAPPISRLPGFRFRPTEEQLFCCYLCNKNHNHSLLSTSNNPFFDFDVIREIDLYNYDPWDLPEIAFFSFGNGGSKKHLYCFTEKVTSEDSKRKAKTGFWKSKGRARDVFGGKEGALLGTKRVFVFYLENSSVSIKTNWVMNEYALVNDHQKDSLVLCRVFVKSRSGNKIAEHVPSSNAEESIAATHDICIDVPCKKHNGASTSGIGVVPAPHEATSVDTDNEIKRFPLKLTCDDPIVTRPVSDDDFGSPVGIPQPNQLAKYSDVINDGVNFGDAVARELMINSAILEGDFIELNDLHLALIPQDK